MTGLTNMAFAKGEMVKVYQVAQNLNGWYATGTFLFTGLIENRAMTYSANTFPQYYVRSLDGLKVGWFVEQALVRVGPKPLADEQPIPKADTANDAYDRAMRGI